MVNVYFDSDKLYVVKPSVVTYDTKNYTVLEQRANDFDIAFVDDVIYGLTGEVIYKDLEKEGPSLQHSYINVFEDDKVLLLKYLFENSYGIPCTANFLNHIFDIKKHYEIKEIMKIREQLVNQEGTTKVKKIRKI